MTLHALFLIAVSALFHMGWNFCVKNSTHKQIYIWWMFLTTFIIFLPVTLWHWHVWKSFPLKAGLACLGAGFMYFLYQICTSKAYQEGDLSLVYPLSNLTPLFVPLWAVVFLHERLSWLGIIGILLTSLGAVLIQYDAETFFFSYTKNKNKRPVLWALSASFFASIGSVLDKAGVERLSEPLIYPYISLMVLFMLGFLTVWVWWRFSPKDIFMGFKAQSAYVLLGGLMLAGSFLFFRYGIKICPISYAVAIRRASIILSVWLGAFILKESHVFVRTLASVVIILGLILLKMG